MAMAMGTHATFLEATFKRSQKTVLDRAGEHDESNDVKLASLYQVLGEKYAWFDKHHSVAKKMEKDLG
eukprot:720996-Alexandrium_andersonii.AAC.1